MFTLRPSATLRVGLWPETRSTKLKKKAEDRRQKKRLVVNKDGEIHSLIPFICDSDSVLKKQSQFAKSPNGRKVLVKKGLCK